MIRIVCGCKINLFLEVGKKRANGLHELRSLFIPLTDPADILEIEHGEDRQLEIVSSNFDLCGPSNLLHRAWRLYAETTGFLPGLRISLVKHIPIGAGLGGGSSDAAALLDWLNSECPAPLESGSLESLALKIGSDVPFFLQNRAAIVSGTGEKVQPVRLAQDPLTIILVCPEINVSTAWAFSALDAIRHEKDGNTEKNLTKQNGRTKKFSFTDALNREKYFNIANDLEGPVFEEFPQLKNLKDRLSDLGAVAAGMSGSGSAIFGIFEDFRLAQNAACKLDDYRHVHIAQWPSAGV